MKRAISYWCSHALYLIHTFIMFTFQTSHFYVSAESLSDCIYSRAGTLDVEEFRHMVRIGLRIAKDDVSDVDLNKLVAALDDDGGGEKKSSLGGGLKGFRSCF